MTSAAMIIQRVWNYCHILRDDGLSYSDYLEQLTYLLFLKLADETGGEPEHFPSIPPNLSWPSLTQLSGVPLQNHYRRILTELGQGSGPIASIFRRAQNKINDPTRPKRLWIYDLRTTQNFSLKQNPLTRPHLDDFVGCFNPANRHERAPTWSAQNPQGRWRAFDYEELLARPEVNLDISWLREGLPEDATALPNPDDPIAEIIEELRLALEQFSQLGEDENAR